MLGAAGDLGFDPGFGQPARENIDYAANIALAFAPRLGHVSFERGVSGRIKIAKGSVFQLGLQPVNPQPMGDGRINFECLGGQFPPDDREADD